MNNEQNYIVKRSKLLKFKHITAILIMSAALISSLDQVACAASKPMVNNARNYIYLTYKEKIQSIAAASDSKKRKSYTSNDRFEILSALTGETIETIKQQIKKGETLESIADMYGVSDEYNFLVLKAYNSGLDKLYNEGKLSDEEYVSMYNNADLSFINSCDAKPKTDNIYGNSGNITALLASVIEKDESEVEQILITGANPWDVAEEYGKFSELKDLVFENTLSNIDAMLESGKITQSEADDIISDFENSFLSKIKSH